MLTEQEVATQMAEIAERRTRNHEVLQACQEEFLKAAGKWTEDQERYHAAVTQINIDRELVQNNCPHTNRTPLPESMFTESICDVCAKEFDRSWGLRNSTSAEQSVP